MRRAESEERRAIGIREVTDADLPFIAEILNHEIETSAFVYAEVPVTLDERRAWLATHRGAGLPVLIALGSDDVPVGWASLSPYRGSSGYRFTVEASVYVSTAARGLGLATRMVNELESIARSQGKHAIVASIDSENAPSVALFEKLGYAEVARLPEVGFKFGAWRTQLLLQKTLPG